MREHPKVSAFRQTANVCPSDKTPPRFSVGPKGRIQKIASFIQIKHNIYSFGFGDLDERTGEISDTVISNNGDGPKVLNTVGAIIFDFTTVYPEATIFVEGSTPSRTRWYQMNLNAFYEEINDSNPRSQPSPRPARSSASK